MNEVLNMVEAFKTIDEGVRTDTLDAVDLGNAMLETKQPGLPFIRDSAVGTGWL